MVTGIETEYPPITRRLFMVEVFGGWRKFIGGIGECDASVNIQILHFGFIISFAI